MNNSIEVNRQELKDLEASIGKLVEKVTKQDIELEELRTYKKLMESAPSKNLFDTIQQIQKAL